MSKEMEGEAGACNLLEMDTQSRCEGWLRGPVLGEGYKADAGLVEIDMRIIPWVKHKIYRASISIAGKIDKNWRVKYIQLEINYPRNVIVFAILPDCRILETPI